MRFGRNLLDLLCNSRNSNSSTFPSIVICRIHSSIRANIVAHSAGAFAPGNLPDRRLTTQVRRINMRTTAWVHLCADNLDNTELGLPWRQEAAVRNQPLQALAAKVFFGPKVDFNRHGLLNVFVYLFLDIGLPLILNGALELAGGALGEVRRLELVEALDLVLEEVADRGAEDVAGRVQPRVQQALLRVNGLLDGGALAEGLGGGGTGEAAEVEDLAVVYYVHAHGADGEARCRRRGAIGFARGGV